MEPDVDLEQLARNLPGFTGADLANLLNEAALSALREGHPSITTADVSNAVDRVVQVGSETCTITETGQAAASDLGWSLSKLGSQN